VTHERNIIVELWFSSEESHDAVPFNVLATDGKHRWNANEIINNRKVKVKQSLHRPGTAPSIPGGWCSQISRQPAHEGGRVVSPTHQVPLPSPRNISGSHVS
jgi:hypothetical protein